MYLEKSPFSWFSIHFAFSSSSPSLYTGLWREHRRSEYRRGSINQSEAQQGLKTSRTSSTSPVYLRMSLNRFTLTPDTPVNRNTTSRANNAADPVALPTGPSLKHRHCGLGRSPTERPRAGTAYARANYSPGSFFDNSPLYQALSESEEGRISAQLSTTRDVDPPKAPEYPFRPPQLEVANPEYDPEFEGPIFDLVRHSLLSICVKSEV